MKIEIQFKDWECLVCGIVSPTAEEARDHQLREHSDVLRIMLLPWWLDRAATYATLLVFSAWPLKLAGRAWARITKPEGPL